MLYLRSFSSFSPGSDTRNKEVFSKFRINTCSSAGKFETESPVLSANSKRQAKMGLGGAAKGQRTWWLCCCVGIAMFDRLRLV
jgi:hypothetical protein